MEGDASNVKDDVGDDESVELPLTVLLGVIDEVAVPVCVGVDGLVDGVIVEVIEEDRERLGVLEEDVPDVNEEVGDDEIVELPLKVPLEVKHG